MLRAIFGTSRPQHRMAVLLPGSEASTVEVRVADTDDDLMALADAAGVTMLAAAIEETAWEGFEDHAGMPGARPIAAAGLAQPDLEQAAAEYEAAHRQAPEPALVGWPAPVLSAAISVNRSPWSTCSSMYSRCVAVSGLSSSTTARLASTCSVKSGSSEAK